MKFQPVAAFFCMLFVLLLCGNARATQRTESSPANVQTAFQCDKPFRGPRAIVLQGCDTLIHSDGSIELIFFRRLTETEIIYCECGATGECEQHISRSEARQLHLSSGIQIEPVLAPQAETVPVSPPTVNGSPGNDQRVLEPMVLTSLIALGLSLILTAAISAPVVWLWGPVGLALGILSFRRIRRFPEQYKGKGLAILSIVLGAINFAFGLAIIAWLLNLI